MKRFAAFSLSLFFFFLSSSILLSNEPLNGQFIVRFKGSPTMKAGMDHSACVSALQKTCHKNVASFQKGVTGLKPSPLWIINACVVEASPKDLTKIKALKNVSEVIPAKYQIWIDPTITGKKALPLADEVQWSIQKVNAPEVWEKLKIDGSGIVVGHLDTGVDGEHPSLQGKILKFKDFTAPQTPSPTASILEKEVAFDDHGHGTHTAGSIVGGNGIGVAPGARLIVGKIFDKDGGATQAGILQAMQWVMDPDGDPETNDGPNLVSNSWGSNSTNDLTFWDAVQAWVDAGILPVFAAGNLGPYGKVGTPGGFPHSWAVGATSKTDSLAYFSSIGPIVWDETTYVKPDISAPGAAVVSAAIGGGLVSNSGTSMACPHVAGLAALMFQANPKLKIDEARAVAEATAVDLGTLGKDNKFGSGRFDAFACVSKILDSTESPLALSVKSYETVLKTEEALIGIKAETPLSGPLALSILARGLDLDEGEFRNALDMVSRSNLDAGKKLFQQLRASRKHSALHQ